MSEIIVEEFSKSVTAKLHPGEERYYSHKLKTGNTLKLLINVPSVVVYAAKEQFC